MYKNLHMSFIFVIFAAQNVCSMAKQLIIDN